ncbi:uncharacterized protein LOC113354058 [Papaver somniferum]|uniref:uncharacterized protein LOC113354058 n=1 Tax=Papaver somniferum TaxID=3469 RepID=UPI000E6FC5AE|nr:uncharacterized protein LOC113354058 [Papaver somniferum]
MGTPVDSSLFLCHCQRCESILQPGSNCIVRIERNGTKKKKQRKNASVPSQNMVVYTCNFCSHRNLKRGTWKNHMKELLLAKLKHILCEEKQLNLVKTKADEGKVDMNVEAIVCTENVAGFKDVVDRIRSRSGKAIESNKELSKTAQELVPIVESETKVTEMDYEVYKDVPSEKSPATPLNRVPMLLLDAKRRNRNRSNNRSYNNQAANESNPTTTDAKIVSGSSTKRRRKSWSSLKELAEANEQKNDVVNLIIPFRL